MSRGKKDTSEQIVNLLRQVEVGVANGKTLPQAPSEAFTLDGTLSELVRRWQRDISMRALRGSAGRRPGVFYVHVGMEDSLGSSVPLGAMAQVEPIEEEEESNRILGPSICFSFRTDTDVVDASSDATSCNF
jgi:hypothetical protein